VASAWVLLAEILRCCRGAPLLRLNGRWIARLLNRWPVDRASRRRRRAL